MCPFFFLEKEFTGIPRIIIVQQSFIRSSVTYTMIITGVTGKVTVDTTTEVFTIIPQCFFCFKRYLSDKFLHFLTMLPPAMKAEVLLGLLLIYLGWKGVLEPMVMIPMGLGMVAINCGTLIMPDGTLGNLFLDPMLSDTDALMNTMQIDFLQPVYTLTFSNGLIACFVFMGIGTLLDVGFLLQKPFASIFLALCAELGTFLTVPIAAALGLTLKESASVAMVGGADGPMVLFTSLALAKHLFVPITVVAYLYLGLTYGGYPYLVKLLVPKRFRAIKMVTKKAPKNYDAKVKLAFSAVLCAVLIAQNK